MFADYTRKTNSYCLKLTILKNSLNYTALLLALSIQLLSEVENNLRIGWNIKKI